MRASSIAVLITLSIAGHSSQGVDPMDRASVAGAYLHWAKAEKPPMQWTGQGSSCEPGTTSLAYQERVISQVNFYRALADLPAVKLSTNQSKYQAAALLMFANWRLSHEPTPDWRCYSEIAKAGSSSNLAIGFSGPDAIDGYMDDPGAGNESVGHRRWILYPKQGAMATGDTPQSNSLGVFEDIQAPRPAVDFVAYPTAGYFPAVLLPKSRRWSFSVAGADFTQATVEMTSTSRASTSLTLKTYPVKLQPVTRGFGDPTLVWEAPVSREVKEDVIVEVRVKRVLVRGVAKDYSYTVTLFNP